MPVLLAAGFAGVSWRTFVVANLPACALWSTVYAAIGVAGGSIFPEPWQSVVAAVILVVLISQIVSWWNKRREARTEPAEESSTSSTASDV